MNDEDFEKLLKDMGAMYRNMEPGPGCPPDDMLLDYVYDELSESERKEIEKHKEHCERCFYEILRLEADRAGWENALEEKPDAAIAQALGPSGVRRVREAIGEASATAQPSAASAPLWKTYWTRIEAGLEKFQAVLASISEEGALFGVISPVLVTRGRRDDTKEIPESVYLLGEQPPVYPISVPLDVQYHTLLTLRHQTKDMVVLYENLRVRRPFHISPQFTPEDTGLNRLCLILSLKPLSIDKGEEEISPDRFMEIVSQAVEEQAKIVLFDVEVRTEE